MKKILLVLLISSSLYAQNGTEIYLMDLSNVSGKITLKNPRNITERIGYDNQPFFHPTKPIIYYSSIRDRQSDIWAYDYKNGEHKQVTNTIDSEYSPTVTPDKKYLSCIVQRKSNGDQDLVKYNLENPADSRILFESQKVGKIGYQAWTKDDELVTFVLGNPQTLHYHNLTTKKDTIIASKIGRSLHQIPNKRAFSFVQEVDNKWLISAYSPMKNTIDVIAESSPESEHYNAWTHDGLLLESRGMELHSYDTKSKKWRIVELPVGVPQKKISRLMIKSNKIAIVFDE
ncbi:MAG: TolB family protein [Spirosomataceae bacterium]